MSKKGISILFSVVFILFIAAPTIITIVDNTADVSVVFSSSEEEDKSFQIISFNSNTNELKLAFTSSENNLGYFFKNYAKPHLNLISPPPELKF